MERPSHRPPAAPAPWSEAQDALADWLRALALAVGLVRFLRLGDWSLWLDEVFAWGDAHGAAMQNPAGYAVIKAVVEALGEGPTETALRLAPAVAGYLCVPLTAWAFAPLAGRRRAWLAAVVVAASAWQVQWAQTARFYTMAQLVTLAGAGLALRGALAGRGARWAAGLLVTAAGALFHPLALALSASLGLAALALPPGEHPEDRSAVRRATLALGLAGVAAAPVVWTRVWLEYSASKGVQDAVGGLTHFVLASGASMTPGVLLLALGGACVGTVTRDRGAGFLTLVCLLNTALLSLASTRAVVTAQYAFTLFPWVALLGAWPIGVRGARSRGGAALAWSGLAVLPLLAGLFLYVSVEHGQRGRWREAVALVEELREPTDLIASTPAVVAEFYVTGATETDVRHSDAVLQLDRWGAGRLEPWLRSGRDGWIIVRNDYLMQMSGEQRARVRRLLGERCALIRRFPVPALGRDLSIDVWRMGG
ncbi:MAG: hypothetical protein VX460_04245 [Planctomycetota bacterium]|nr:hypothetical protein [Planctomycetota bacterium]